MDKLEDYHSRLTSALDRISGKLDGMISQTNDVSDASAVHAALEDEKIANAQLQERIKSLNAKLDASGGTASSEDSDNALAELTAQFEAVKSENAQLIKANQTLSESAAKSAKDAKDAKKALKEQTAAMETAAKSQDAETGQILAELDRIIALKDGAA